MEILIKTIIGGLVGWAIGDICGLLGIHIAIPLILSFLAGTFIGFYTKIDI